MRARRKRRAGQRTVARARRRELGSGLWSRRHVCSGGGTEGTSDMEAGADVEGRAGAVGGVAGGDGTPLPPLDPPPGLFFPSSFFLNRENQLMLFWTPSTAGDYSRLSAKSFLGEERIRHFRSGNHGAEQPLPDSQVGQWYLTSTRRRPHLTSHLVS